MSPSPIIECTMQDAQEDEDLFADVNMEDDLGDGLNIDEDMHDGHKDDEQNADELRRGVPVMTEGNNRAQQNQVQHQAFASTDVVRKSVEGPEDQVMKEQIAPTPEEVYTGEPFGRLGSELRTPERDAILAWDKIMQEEAQEHPLTSGESVYCNNRQKVPELCGEEDVSYEECGASTTSTTCQRETHEIEDEDDTEDPVEEEAPQKKRS